MRVPMFLLLGAVLGVSGCSSHGTRGIADKRTDFKRFIPMEGDPAKYGLKAVRPYFNTANRPEILRAIESACRGEKAGSSVQNPANGAGYYVNCNPHGRQLLNGYIPLDPHRRPHSE